MVEDITKLPEFIEYEKAYKNLMVAGKAVLRLKDIPDNMRQVVEKEMDRSFLTHSAIMHMPKKEA